MNDIILSVEPVETDAIITSLGVTAVNFEIISKELAEIMMKINSGTGTLGRLIQDSTIAENINTTIINLRKSSKGLDENMNAAKSSFLLKGFFNKRARLAEKNKQDSIKKMEQAAKNKQDSINKIEEAAKNIKKK